MENNQVPEKPEQFLERTYGLSSVQVNNVIATALNGHRQTAYCDLYFQKGKTEMLYFDEGILKSSSRSRISGVGVRVITGDKTGFASTDTVTYESLLSRARAAGNIVNYADGVLPAIADMKAPERKHDDLYALNGLLLDVDKADKVNLLKRVDEAARQVDPRIVNVSATLNISEQVVVIATSTGYMVLDKRPMLVLQVKCLAVEGNRREEGSSGGGGRIEFAFLLTDGFWLEHAQTAARRAVALLSAVPAPVGEKTVVLGAGWPGVIIHESVGHPLEADSNRKLTSAFSNRIGERVASPLCTIIDDGTIANRRGSLTVDDEGTPTQKNVLIEKGILLGYMQDRQNAALMGAQLTGNGRRESYAFPPIPRMTNTYLASGESTREEVIASVKDGVYMESFSGGQVDSASANFTFTSIVAYPIENGRLIMDRPLKGATLIGNGMTALHNITMVANDSQLDKGIGMCGKERQSVAVGVGMATTRIEGLTVGGTKS